MDRGVDGYGTPRTGRAQAAITLAFVVLTVVTGCATPEHVRDGVAPHTQDDLVRFRSTYYLHTFDLCRGATTPPQPHSLFRFRMTGKANALSNVRFESGILDDAQLNPFKAIVRFDRKRGQFRLVSPAEPSLDAGVSGQIHGLRQQLTDDIPPFKVTPTNGKSGGCDHRSGPRRVFRIVGPEGVRTLDQTSRLILSMTSNHRSLLGKLKELSDRVLNEKLAAARTDSDLNRVRLNTLQAQQALLEPGGDTSMKPDERIERLIRTLESTEVSK